jgi:hypothetical protein
MPNPRTWAFCFRKSGGSGEWDVGGYLPVARLESIPLLPVPESRGPAQYSGKGWPRFLFADIAFPPPVLLPLPLALSPSPPALDPTEGMDGQGEDAIMDAL